MISPAALRLAMACLDESLEEVSVESLHPSLDSPLDASLVDALIATLVPDLEDIVDLISDIEEKYSEPSQDSQMMLLNVGLPNMYVIVCFLGGGNICCEGLSMGRPIDMSTLPSTEPLLRPLESAVGGRSVTARPPLPVDKPDSTAVLRVAGEQPGGSALNIDRHRIYDIGFTGLLCGQADLEASQPSHVPSDRPRPGSPFNTSVGFIPIEPLNLSDRPRPWSPYESSGGFIPIEPLNLSTDRPREEGRSGSFFQESFLSGLNLTSRKRTSETQAGPVNPIIRPRIEESEGGNQVSGKRWKGKGKGKRSKPNQ
ncbi:hypothetical protein JYU34_000112 [Plutella xylostella]|uniref:Uncharacterized protein n=1 Tax=Plutella xylostella TaxID=51655 RepID=A0ABQ7R6U7_PLUXY|nr:hypothetical protein JYU34_000112 [Plutella xylostella]